MNIMERLRPLVGSKGWDYCLLWKLSEDQRSLEWMGCCCGGAENNNGDHEHHDDQNGGKELVFPVSALVPCRDVMFQHPRTMSCDLIALRPSSIPLDPNYHLIHAQTLISNQPKWLNFSNSSTMDSGHLPENETIGTKVLVPVPGGLVELFVSKQFPEDQHVVNFITTQLNISIDEEAIINQTNNMDFTNSDQNTGHDHDNNHFHPMMSPAGSALDNLSLPYDVSADRIRLSSNSPMNFLHQFHDGKNKTDAFFKESDKDPFKYSSSQGGLQEMDMMNQSSPNVHVHFMEHGAAKEDQNDKDKDSVKREMGRTDSVSDCSDQVDDEDNPKFPRRGEKGTSKNLVAERKRRKKLNDRLYHLRALVPNISKLDRASILGDAIEFVKELQKQAKELQDELEDNSDEEGAKKNNNSTMQSEIQNRGIGCKTEQDHKLAGDNKLQNMYDHHRDQEVANDKTQQMEPQVEVWQIDGNEFFLKVFCEYKAGGFVRLMEALSSLGLVVTNANVTRFRGLVSNVFRVEMRDCEMIQADHVRDSLLELTRDSYKVGVDNLEFHHPQDIYNHAHINAHHHHLHRIHD